MKRIPRAMRPTRYPPKTNRKIMVMRERAERYLPLFHPDDTWRPSTIVRRPRVLRLTGIEYEDTDV